MSDWEPRGDVGSGVDYLLQSAIQDEDDIIIEHEVVVTATQQSKQKTVTPKARQQPVRSSTRNKGPSQALPSQNALPKATTTIEKCENVKLNEATTSKVPVKQESLLNNIPKCVVSNPYFGKKPSQPVPKATDKDKTTANNQKNDPTKSTVISNTSTKIVTIPFLDEKTSTVTPIDIPMSDSSFPIAPAARLYREKSPEIPGLTLIDMSPGNTTTTSPNDLAATQTASDNPSADQEMIEKDSSTVKAAKVGDKVDNSGAKSSTTNTPQESTQGKDETSKNDQPSTVSPAPPAPNTPSNQVNGTDSGCITLDGDKCVNIGCTNRAKSDPQWDNEFCSDRCAVSFVKSSFRNWVGINN